MGGRVGMRKDALAAARLTQGHLGASGEAPQGRLMLGPAPTWIGCVRCGGEFHVDMAVYVQCEACGKTCGLCLGCDRVMPRSFLDGSLEWHLARKHPDLTLPSEERKRLLRETERWNYSARNPLVL